MKKAIVILLAAALLCGLTACMGQNDPAEPTGDLTSPVTTVKVDENEDGGETTAAPEAQHYALESEEGGYSLTFDAAPDASPEVEQKENALTVRSAETDAALTLRVEAPQSKETLDAKETQALADGGEQVMLGHYGGYTVPADGEAVVLLEKLPGTDTWFTLHIAAEGDTEIGAALKDAAVAAFLSTMVFNINI